MSERAGDFPERFYAIRAVRSAPVGITSRSVRCAALIQLAWRNWALGILIALFFSPPTLPAQYSTADMASGAKELIGQPAPAWLHRGWVNSESLELKELRGKVVLIRFFSDNPVGAEA